MIRRYLAVTIALVVLLGVGYWHGVRAGRYGTDEALVAAVERVALVPKEFEDWTSQERESDPTIFKLAGADRYWTRVYRHPRVRTPLLVILMCGRSGKMSVHTPEICYAGAGYEMVNLPTTMPMASPFTDESFGSFWSARFGKARGGDLRLVWGWSTASGVWQAPESPRFAFTGQPFLYKLYVSHDHVGGVNDSEPAKEFLRDFLPELKQTLFPAVAAR